MNFDIKRAFVMAYRNFLQLKRDPAKLLHVFYWSFLDIVIWGYSASWIQKDSVSSIIGISLLAAVVFWQFIVRSNLDLCLGILEEVVSHNITNLFASPLNLSEWIIGLLLVSSFISIILLFFCYLIVLFIYKISLFAIFGWSLFLFLGLLFMAGTSFGFLSGALIIKGGSRYQSLVFMMGWLFAPLGGIFYPISVLPFWVQAIASRFPLMYIFDAMRNFIKSGLIDWYLIINALFLNLLYLLIFITIFYLTFKNSKKNGLSRLIE